VQDGASSEHSVSKRRCDGKANAQEDTVGHATVAAKRMDGKACAAEVESELLQRVVSLKESNIQPHLAVIIVGDDPASHVYVNAKVRMCERLGIRSTHIALPADTDESVLRQHIETMNHQQDLDGILVQSPLPNHMDEEALTDMIHPSKDVDGFHPQNLGRLVQGRVDGMLPCTPSGVMRMLEWAGIELQGKNAVVLGRSRIVGMPAALLLAARGADATVTVAHSKTDDIERICSEADVVVAAVGRPEMVRSSWIKPGAVVVDVGINRVDDESRERGWRLAGDVHPEVAETAGWLSPVPGGVGPMTIAMLMENTVRAAEVRRDFGSE
jgi:methylenetetrahydrofolate dehydrogenase (NADP+)/methenyltetrahydrofolate cyclohydrolase